MTPHPLWQSTYKRQKKSSLREIVLSKSTEERPITDVPVADLHTVPVTPIVDTQARSHALSESSALVLCARPCSPAVSKKNEMVEQHESKKSSSLNIPVGWSEENVTNCKNENVSGSSSPVIISTPSSPVNTPISSPVCSSVRKGWW